MGVTIMALICRRRKSLNHRLDHLWPSVSSVSSLEHDVTFAGWYSRFDRNSGYGAPISPSFRFPLLSTLAESQPSTSYAVSPVPDVGCFGFAVPRITKCDSKSSLDSDLAIPSFLLIPLPYPPSPLCESSARTVRFYGVGIGWLPNLDETVCAERNYWSMWCC